MRNWRGLEGGSEKRGGEETGSRGRGGGFEDRRAVSPASIHSPPPFPPSLTPPQSYILHTIPIREGRTEPDQRRAELRRGAQPGVGRCAGEEGKGREGRVTCLTPLRRRYPPRSLIPSSSGPLNYIFISIAHST